MCNDIYEIYLKSNDIYVLQGNVFQRLIMIYVLCFLRIRLFNYEWFMMQK